MSKRDTVQADPSDGLPAMPVGEWTRDKLSLLRLYIEIARGVRAKFTGPGKAGAAFVDLFCGPGRAFIKGTHDFIDGSPIVAWKASKDCGVPFTSVHLNDAEPDLLRAACVRLERLGAPVERYGGKAEEIARDVVERLDGRALNFALLDPFNLQMLPFNVRHRRISAPVALKIHTHVVYRILGGVAKATRVRCKEIRTNHRIQTSTSVWLVLVARARDRREILEGSCAPWAEDARSVLDAVGKRDMATESNIK
jgi:hypothetical protein